MAPAPEEHLLLLNNCFFISFMQSSRYTACVARGFFVLIEKSFHFKQPPMTSLRDRQLDFVRQALASTMLKPTPLAQKAGVTPSTLSKFLNGETDTLRQTTIDRIAAFARLETVRPSGMEEAEVVPYVGKPFASAPADAGDTFAMKVNTRLLDLRGIEPGDILYFDRSRKPKSGDIVCAQIYDHRMGSAETVIRLVQGNFLVAHAVASHDVSPLFIDDRSVLVVGTLTRQQRDRTF